MRQRVLLAAMALAAVAAIVLVASGGAAPTPRDGKPEAVKSASDKGKAKLHPKLVEKLESGSTALIPVYVTTAGDAETVKAKLKNAYAAVADGGEGALVVGSVRVPQLAKLGSVAGVISVGPVDFEKTGSPLGSPEPTLNQRPSTASLQSFMNNLRKQEVPYSAAPQLRPSNFEALKELNLLDAKTHRFAAAWKAGYTGSGETVSILDGGTDWGHPDLIGTWNSWSGLADTAGSDDGWNGWPQAFDPYGTLIFLAAPQFVDQGLSWYVKTVEKTTADFTQNDQDLKHDLWRVSFATKTGPSRNFSAPAGTNTHAYTFPKAWAPGGKVRLGSHPDDHLLQLFQERPAFLLLDTNNDGQYETIYVDLDNDYQFADEKPVTKASPVAYRDMNGDGYTDLSGGLAYFISDGATKIPGGLTVFQGAATPKPPAGEMVAWTGDFDPAIGGHGTLTASNILGQGVVNGKAPTFGDVPGGRYPGAVIGGAPHAKGAPMGDIYFSFDFSTQLGYFLTGQRSINVTTNSYGQSATDNDGWDAGSQEASFWHTAFGNRTTPLFSTGNGAPGYGTEAPPSPHQAIAVGASTQFGGTGWDSIANASQIVDNDVMVWSNRGPGATGSSGTDLVADGAFSPGDATLNTVLDGNDAWTTWGGTSRSAPVAGAATLLVYDAFKQANGVVPAGFNAKAREILKAGALDLGYDGWTQGSGSVDAKRATEIAASGGSVTPDAWRVGDYRGSHYSSFTHIVSPGGSDAQSFTVSGSGTYTVSDRYLQRTASVSKKFTSSPVNKESAYNFNAPDYLLNLTSEVNAHPNADLMVVRANFPYAQFDGNGNYREDQAWRLLTYNWTDVNGDGNLWTDTDRDGTVDHVDTAFSSNIDHNHDINFSASEIDKGEYVRFMYHRAGSNTLQSFVRAPKERMAKGLFLGLQHSARTPAIPQTSFDIQIDFYENVDWPWLTAPASVAGGSSFTATVNVPGSTPAGMYDGAIVLTKDSRNTVVPVTVAVAATPPQDPVSGKVTGSMRFGGAATAAAQAGSLYNNGAVFGATDWTWRPESGDWRFYFFDALKAPPSGTLWLADTAWQGTSPATDIDTLLFGRSTNSYQLVGGSGSLDGGPYVIGTVGKSPNTNIGAGVWTFNTATGGARDIVAAPAQGGLQAVVLHQVNHQGDQFSTPVESMVGAASVTPTNVDVTSAADTGTFELTFESNINLDGLVVEGFGLSQPTTENVTVKQDDPNDPSSASVKRNLTLMHASRLSVNFDMPTDDVDLYVVRDANGDGQFTTSEIVGSSTTSSAHEAVTLVRPADGNYQIWAQGWAVSGTPTGVLKIDPIAGNDITVTGVPSGPIAANTPVTLTGTFNKAMTAGQSYFGEILLGPTVAPTAMRVPVKITRS